MLTAATSAQNRAGSAVKGEGLDHRMEFFDPKTRPVAVFWDSDALLTAPPSLARNTGAAVFWRAAMNMGAANMTPLVEGDRLQALRLARGALPRLADATDPAPRIELCAAAFLQNRDADDGGTLVERHWVGRVVYAFAAALFNQHGHVSQGEANSALTPGVMRKLGARDPDAMCRIAAALDAWREGDPIEDAPERGATALEQIFQSSRHADPVSAARHPAREPADHPRALAQELQRRPQARVRARARSVARSAAVDVVNAVAFMDRPGLEFPATTRGERHNEDQAPEPR